MQSIFGDLKYDDKRSLAIWTAAHDQAHKTLQLAASRNGTALSRVPLDGEISGGWFGTHWLVHKALQRVVKHTDLSTTNTMISSEWKSEREFYNWHQAHNQMHAQLEKALKVHS
jgi:hypothetical protein